MILVFQHIFVHYRLSISFKVNISCDIKQFICIPMRRGAQFMSILYNECGEEKNRKVNRDKMSLSNPTFKNPALLCLFLSTLCTIFFDDLFHLSQR